MAEQLGARLLAEVEADTLDEVRSSSMGVIAGSGPRAVVAWRS